MSLAPVAKRFPRSPETKPALDLLVPNKKAKVDIVKAEEIMKRQGEWIEGILDCLCMIVLPTATPAEGNMSAYERIPGRYYKIDMSFNGYPVFRQEQTDDANAPNNQELFCYYCPVNGRAGWFIGADIKCLHQDESQLAWAEALPDSILPPVENWHIPVWAKSPITDVVCSPLKTFLEHEIVELKGELELLKNDKATDVDTDVGKSASSKGDGKGDNKSSKGNKDKGKNGQKKPSGWLERTAPLIAMLANGDYEEATSLANELALRYDMAGELVRVERRKSWAAKSASR
jgi:hypothetical protein